jgi:hypothetical protein
MNENITLSGRVFVLFHLVVPKNISVKKIVSTDFFFVTEGKRYQPPLINVKRSFNQKKEIPKDGALNVGLNYLENISDGGT